MGEQWWLERGAVYQFLLFGAIFLLVLTFVRLFFALQKRESTFAASQKGTLLWQLIREFFARFSYINTFLPVPKYRQRIQRLLLESAREHSLTFEELVAMQELLAIGLPLASYLLVTDSLIVALVAGILGWYAPIIRLDGDRKRRQKRILADLPYMMDLLTLSVEAGADFIFAIQNIIDNFPDRPLREELRILLRNIRSGLSRKEALQRFRERLNLFEVSGLCSALIRADEMGTGLVEVLRLQSQSIKQKRAQERREKAKRAATLMTVPLVIFIFPCMFILILGPVAIKVVQMLMGG
jgi:tight adherence protein C